MVANEFLKVLWDIDPSRVADLPESFVIRRALAYGGVGLIFLLIRTYGIQIIRDEFDAMKVTSMDARRHHYLKEYVLI